MSEDAISRQAMHIELEKWITYGEYKYSNATKYLYDRIDRLPPVTPKQRWIPVSERLPKTNGQYLVTKAIGDYTYIGCMDYSTNLAKTDKFDFHGKNYAGWYEYDMEYGFLETDGVIAWMPLPEPYGESEG